MNATVQQDLFCSFDETLDVCLRQNLCRRGEGGVEILEKQGGGGDYYQTSRVAWIGDHQPTQTIFHRGLDQFKVQREVTVGADKTHSILPKHSLYILHVIRVERHQQPHRLDALALSQIQAGR